MCLFMFSFYESLFVKNERFIFDIQDKYILNFNFITMSETKKRKLTQNKVQFDPQDKKNRNKREIKKTHLIYFEQKSKILGEAKISKFMKNMVFIKKHYGNGKQRKLKSSKLQVTSA